MGGKSWGMQWGKRGDMIVHEQEPFNAEPPRAPLAADTLTDVRAFYVRNHGPVPPQEDGWRLTVDGDVRGARSWTVDELRCRFPVHEVTATMQCAGNRRTGFLPIRDLPGDTPWGPGATGTAVWSGVRLADVLRDAEPGPGAAYVCFAAADVSALASPPQPFGGSIPLAKAMSDEVLLAWGMNGEPLPAVHGAPLRAVVPGWIGARSVKWLRQITLGSEPSENFFQRIAYRLLPAEADPAEPGGGLALGPIALNCDILQPDDGAQVTAGRTEVVGYALAGGDRTVARVDVSTDDGRSWVQADLGEPTGRWAWRLWRTQLDLPPGPVTVTARAWDDTGAAQPEDPGPLWNPKGYANNSWGRVQLRIGDGPPS